MYCRDIGGNKTPINYGGSDRSFYEQHEGVFSAGLPLERVAGVFNEPDVYGIKLS